MATNQVGEVCAELAKRNRAIADARWKPGEATIAAKSDAQPPPGFLSLAGAVEQAIRQMEPELVRLLGLTDTDSFRGAVKECFALPLPQADAENLRRQSLLFDHDISVGERSRKRQLLDLRECLFAVEARLWTAFAESIGSLNQSEAIALGALRDDLPDLVRVATKRKLGELNGAAQPHVIARTGAHIAYRAQQPALALLDFDSKGMPPEVSARLDELVSANVIAALRESHPEVLA